jgi:S1-C subfamily serine protease
MSTQVSIGHMKPVDVILPLLEIDNRGNVHDFLGTGFFVGEESLFITAHHNTDLENSNLAVVHLDDLDTLFPASVIYSDSNSDVAVLGIPGYQPQNRLVFAEESAIAYNQPVVSLEYGTTISRGRETILSPATRLGNISREFKNFDFKGKILPHALEVSFPALRGASGAPLLTNQGFLIAGMLVGNVSYHLLPAQIETIADQEGKVTEETKFMLPQAIAVHVSALRSAYKQATGT